MSLRREGRLVEVAPSAARLTGSLRDIGYDLPTAVADLVDNSIGAGASKVHVDLTFKGSESTISILDNGLGMSSSELDEALRFGTRRKYGESELGRYGLGLKTAPLSQCRRVTVVTRRSATYRVITTRTLDLDLVQQTDRWVITDVAEPAVTELSSRWLDGHPGTVVVWQKLDRVLPYQNIEGGWAKRRIEILSARVAEHLGMIFHRFLEGSVTGRKRLQIRVNGERVKPWNPFALGEPATQRLPEQRFELISPSGVGEVTLRPYILPPKDQFSSASEFERMSGPLKWNRQQGLYVYRADRLVQWGGWSGLRGIDEHTKLARAAIDFSPLMDEAFNINVSKMRVAMPAELRQMIERPIHELCILANDAYRKSPSEGPREPRGRRPATVSTEVGLAFTAAAIELGHSALFEEIVALIRKRDPALLSSIGLS